ncbi:MAG: hypothetical protein HYX40_04265 [Sphingobacteriales bacterium]|nr:hypothetical protein [Sphingobacteriales bacterium]
MGSNHFYKGSGSNIFVLQLKTLFTTLIFFIKRLAKRLLPLLMLPVVFISCKKDNSTVTAANSTTGTDPSVVATQGKWSVSSYTQKTEDKTSSLSGTVFTFTSDGKVTANNGGKSETGT